MQRKPGCWCRLASTGRRCLLIRHLGLLLYVWAIILSQPLWAVLSDAQNTYWRGNQVGMGSYGYAHQSVNDVKWSNDVKFGVRLDIPINFWNFDVKHATDRWLLSCTEIGFGGARHDFISNNVEVLHRTIHQSSTHPSSKKCHTRSSFVVIRKLLLDDRYLFLKRRFDLKTDAVKNLTCIQPIVDRSRKESRRIKASISVFCDASDCPPNRSRLSNLAYASFDRSAATEFKTVCSKQDAVLENDHNYFCRHTSTRIKKREKQTYGNKCRWRFMRFAPGGGAAFQWDKSTGYPVLDLDNEDIDVSCDGVTWVHIGGPRCLSHARRLLAKATFGSYLDDPFVRRNLIGFSPTYIVASGVLGGWGGITKPPPKMIGLPRLEAGSRCPIENKASLNALTNCSSSPLISMPVRGGMVTPSTSGYDITLSGPDPWCVPSPPPVNTRLRMLPSLAASGSMYIKIKTNLPPNGSRVFAIAVSSVGDISRGWINAFSLRFSAFNPSVFWFSNATSWSDAVLNSAFLLRSSALLPFAHLLHVASSLPTDTSALESSRSQSFYLVPW